MGTHSRGGRAKPDYLKVVDGNATPKQKQPEVCGAPTQSGGPCRNPAGEDGSCWLEGHQPGHDPRPASYPPPEHLGEYGRMAWEKHVDEAVRLGILTQLDWSTFESFCELYQLCRDAWVDLEEEGTSVEGRKGVKKNPALTAYLNAKKEMRQYQSELGFTPSARARLEVPGPDEGKEGIEQYL